MFNNLQEFREHLRKMKEDPEYKNKHKEKAKQELKARWLELEPFEKAEDIPEIPKVETEEYKNFFVPILTKNGAVAKKDLVDGEWYYGDHRNCNFAKWNQKENQFNYIRYKFGNNYWDNCNHFEDDDGFALLVPLRKATAEEIKKQEDSLKK